MFATFLTLALFAASSLNAVAADFSVATPTNVTQCKPVQFTWEATKGPYNLIIVKSAEPCGAVIQELGDHPNPSMTWTTNLTAGVDYTLSVEDANGDEGWSEAMTVLAGTDTSCLNNAAAVPSSASGASASGKSSAAVVSAATQAVGAAGAAVTGGSTSDDGTDGTPLGAASGGSSGASALHMSPFMAACALFAVAIAL